MPGFEAARLAQESMADGGWRGGVAAASEAMVARLAGSTRHFFGDYILKKPSDTNMLKV